MSFPLRTRTRGRPGRNAGVTNVAATPSFSNPLTGWTTDPLHGFWASDPLWTPPADGGAVSSWRNGGSVGGDLVQATGSRQPTYRASTAAFNSKPTVQDDGIDDQLVTATLATITQPVWVVLLAQYLPGAYGTRALFDGSAATTRIYDAGAAQHSMFGGVLLNTGVAISTSVPHLHVCQFNGATSTYQLNGSAIGSGAAGANGITAITLLAATGGSQAASAHIAYAAVFTTDPTGQAEWAAFKAWCLSFYGVTVA